MDYEKKYKEAIERMKSWARGEHPECFSEAQKAAEFVFPELAESGDEKIRREIIDYCHERLNTTYGALPNIETIKRWLAWLEKQKDTNVLIQEASEKAYTEGMRVERKHWLEKQCEQEQDVRYKYLEDLITADDIHQMAINDTMVKEAKSKAIDALSKLGVSVLLGLENQDNEPVWCHHKVDLSDCTEEYCKAYYDGWNNCNMQHSQCKSELDDVVKCLINGMKFYYEDNEEATWGTDKWSMPVKHIIDVLEGLCEKKPTEAKPKFKVGDWIYSNNVHEDYRTCKIVKIGDNKYYIESVYGYVGYNTFETFEKDYNLWTIQDANDGDVLVYENEIFIAKHFSNLSLIYYCCYDGKLFITDSFYSLTINDLKDIKPATQEQRELLFQKMKEAGYEWDSENKGLTLLISNGGDFESNNSKQKHTWSEEDEKRIDRICDFVWKNRKGDTDEIYQQEQDVKWLKSLKDIVQPKQQWSEEDKMFVHGLIRGLTAKRDIHGHTTFSSDYINITETIHWLESLKQRLGG